ncbi:MAG: PolC-type DNA polymerase III [Oscillospiraceae bacterium]
MKVPFFQVFTAFVPEDEGLCADLAQCMVSYMKADCDSRAIMARLVPSAPFSQPVLTQLEQALARAYEVSTVTLLQDVPEAAVPAGALWDAAQSFLLKQFPPARGLLAGATCETSEGRMTVTLPHGGSSSLASFAAALSEKLLETGGQRLTVQFVDAQEGDTQEFLRKAEKGRREAVKHASEPPKTKEQMKKGKTFFGSVSMKTITPISSLDLDMGTVLLEGDVFAVDHKELKNRTDCIIRFDITDYNSSVRVTKFMTQQESKSLLKNLQVGQRVLVQGRVTLDDRFENDLVIQPTGIMLGERTRRKDSAAEKRVELHLHTWMSAMDALTDTKKVVKCAAEWGHPAIAITDHGVAHSFPDAASGAKGTDLKVLYGVEAYYTNDMDGAAAVHGDAAQPLESEYVVFDLETTGFDSKRDAIIEIGAVVLRDGKLGEERFSSFASPGVPLSPKIISLTGITDEMLEGAPAQDVAVTAFLQFAGNRPLVAHNADFDIGFLTQAAGRIGVPFHPTTVDTLALGRHLYPDLSNHKLDTIARHLQLEEFHHHRAYDDAATAALILARELAILKERGVKRLDEVDPALAGTKVGGKTRRSPYHLIILAKNNIGLRNLYKLISCSFLEHYSRVPIMPKSLICENREGLIIGSACEAGELFKAVVEGKPQEELERIAAWYDYLEIQPTSNNAFMLRPGKEGRQIAQSVEDLRDFNRAIVDLGHKLGKPVCATGDVHFMEPEDEIFRHILLDSKGFEDGDSPNPLYFKTTDEMLEEFSYLGAETAREVVVTNTNLIADWCDRVAPLPTGLFPPKLENSAEELSTLVWGKAKRLYGEEPPQIVVDRINAELGDIIRCKYDVIYMSAQKLVQNSMEHGYLVGSRGSVGSSLVAFMSGITEVNSLAPHYRCPQCKHADFDAGEGFGCGADMPDGVCPVCGARYEKDGFNIPFETFLGFGGDKIPDIDLNFSGEYQAKAHKYTFELFGEGHVFKAGTIGTVASKTAYGYVKKYLAKRGLVATKAEENRLALGCTGVKKTTSQHPGGMVVIPADKEIYDFCPVQHPADDKDSDIITTHFDYHAMDSNLLKLDMLGHDDPSMIRMLEDLTGVNATEIPLDDKDTMSIFTSSEILGFTGDPILGPTGACAIPEFGTNFVRGMLEDTKPTEFDILVRLSGFSHGTDVWLGNARELIKSGQATVSQAIGCRDDIMLYLIHQGMEAKRSFKIMEAVRKGKGLPDGAEDEMRQHGVPDWYIGSCKKIAYLFPKAHAVAYVMMAFRIAWFKVHRPLAFYATYFSIRAKAFDATVMCQGMDMVKGKIAELRAKDKDATGMEEGMLVTLEVCYEFYRRGFHFEAIDLYRSDAVRFKMDEEKGTLLPPFTSVPGLGETAAQSIVEQQSSGQKFISISEFTAACPKVGKGHIEGLKAAGALAGIPETSQMTLFG